MTGEHIHTIAPMPTKKTVRRRTSVPMQAYRFAVVSLRMLKMIRRTHMT